ncbi:MAG TPA: DUF4240 domain-containing protein [Gemmataceae bacterium]|nr:DUF4240 domain-containing protein [Gemmataceae bacterium]
MTLDEFWDHIKKSKRRDPDAHVGRLTARLAKLPPDDILDFVHWWDFYARESYDWTLWGAAYLINGGCSDDGFDYFRDWLILQGRDVFQAAVSDPDTLADVVDGEEVECGCHPGADAWFEATGAEKDAAGYQAFDAAMKVRHPLTPAMPDLGDDWDHDNDAEMNRRFPRLWAMYKRDDDDD